MINSPKHTNFFGGNIMNCPSCQSTHVKKNGHIHNGKQNFRCKDCGRQFVADKEKKEISDHDKQIIKNLLSERLSLRGICRALNVSLTWLLHFFREVTDEIPDDLGGEDTGQREAHA